MPPVHAVQHCSCLNAQITLTAVHAMLDAAYLTRERLDKAKKLQLIINLSEGAGPDMTECWAL
jgi:hypothetical protein